MAVAPRVSHRPRTASASTRSPTPPCQQRNKGSATRALATTSSSRGYIVGPSFALLEVMVRVILVRVFRRFGRDCATAAHNSTAHDQHMVLAAQVMLDRAASHQVRSMDAQAPISAARSPHISRAAASALRSSWTRRRWSGCGRSSGVNRRSSSYTITEADVAGPFQPEIPERISSRSRSCRRSTTATPLEATRREVSCEPRSARNR